MLQGWVHECSVGTNNQWRRNQHGILCRGILLPGNGLRIALRRGNAASCQSEFSSSYEFDMWIQYHALFAINLRRSIFSPNNVILGIRYCRNDCRRTVCCERNSLILLSQGQARELLRRGPIFAFVGVSFNVPLFSLTDALRPWRKLNISVLPICSHRLLFAPSLLKQSTPTRS